MCYQNCLQIWFHFFKFLAKKYTSKQFSLKTLSRVTDLFTNGLVNLSCFIIESSVILRCSGIFAWQYADEFYNGNDSISRSTNPNRSYKRFQSEMYIFLLWTFDLDFSQIQFFFSSWQLAQPKKKNATVQLINYNYYFYLSWMEIEPTQPYNFVIIYRYLKFIEKCKCT